MKSTTRSLTTFFTISALVASTASLSAQVTTNPVGYVTQNVADGADGKFGISMEQASILSGAVADSVVGSVINSSQDPSAATSGHYVQFTSGNLVGHWFQVFSSDTGSITVAEDLESLGALGADTFKVVPFWTLSSLFSGDFPVSTDVFSPAAQVLMNDVTATGINLAPNLNYAYHDGSSGFVAAGWYNVSDAFSGPQDDVIVAPNTFITIRNQSGGAYALVISGAVPVNVLSVAVVADASIVNDNLIYNPYPTEITLSTSALTDIVAVSSNVFAPVDQVIVYGSPTGLNPSPDKNYAYHDGSSGFVAAGWYNVSDAFGGSRDSITIPAGGAFIIRKAAGSTSGYWTAAIPYTL
jgi:uncharacterized protein (TIGR02597 family)